MESDMDRVFRITLRSKRKDEEDYKFVKKYFYDSKEMFEMELKHRDNELKQIDKKAWNYSAKLICEEFKNNQWCFIEIRKY